MVHFEFDFDEDAAPASVAAEAQAAFAIWQQHYAETKKQYSDLVNRICRCRDAVERIRLDDATDGIERDWKRWGV